MKRNETTRYKNIGRGYLESFGLKENLYEIGVQSGIQYRERDIGVVLQSKVENIDRTINDYTKDYWLEGLKYFYIY